MTLYFNLLDIWVTVIDIRVPTKPQIRHGFSIEMLCICLPGGAVVKGAVLQRQLYHQRLWVLS